MSGSETRNNLTVWNFKAAYGIIEEAIEQGNLDQAIDKCDQGLKEATGLKNIMWVKKFDSIKQEIINLRKSEEDMDSTKKKVMVPRLEGNEVALKMEDINILENGANTLEQEEAPNDELSIINGVGSTTELRLKEAGIVSIKQLATITPESLAQINGFGLNSSGRIISAAKGYLEKQNKPYESKERKNYLERPMFDPKYRIDRSSKISTPSKIRQNVDSDIGESIKEEDFDIEEFDEQTNEDPTENTEIIDEIIPSVELDEDNEENDVNFNTNELGGNVETMKSNSVAIKQPQESEITKNEVINDFLNDVPEIPQNNTPEIQYEQVMHELQNEFTHERLNKNYVTAMLKKVQEIFQSFQYFIIPKTSHLLRKVNRSIDCIAIKVISGSTDTELILISPIKICDLKGTLLVLDNGLDYHSEDNPKLQEKSKALLLKSVVKDFIAVQSIVFDSVVNDENIFTFFRKYLKDSNISIEKGRNNQALFFRSGLLQYKILIEPILLCHSLPSSLEKNVLFPYQRSTNIHYIDHTQLSSLITFMEHKYQSLESHCIEGNSVKKYFQAKFKFIKDLRSYSIPFVFFGLIFLLIVILQGGFLINTFISLGSAAICVYGILLIYLYVKFTKAKTHISKEFSTPYHLGKVNIEDTELLIISKDLSSEQMDQFIYECFGKEADFTIMQKIEEDKYSHSLVAKKQSRKPGKISLDHSITVKSTLTKSLTSKNGKYSSFLED